MYASMTNNENIVIENPADNDEVEEEDRPECDVCCYVYDEDGGCECVVCKYCDDKHSHYAELCYKCCMCNGIDKGSSPFNIKCCMCEEDDEIEGIECRVCGHIYENGMGMECLC
jgi:hypothetical protein